MADELLCLPSDVTNAWAAFGQLPIGEQTSLIATASQMIIDFCRRGFGQELITESFDGKGLPRVWLSRRPVISVSSVTIGDDALDNTDGKAWSFNAATGELRRGDGQRDIRFAPRFFPGRQNVVVQYWGGYAAIPDKIVRATVMAARYLHNQMNVSGVYSAERIGDYNYTLNAQAFAMTLPAHIAALCAHYVQDDGPL